MDNKVIHAVFEEAVKKNSSGIAIRTATDDITYLALNIQANRLANLLRNEGHEKSHVIATLFDDALLQIYALLGIFKSGSIYLPLDKKFKDSHWNRLYLKIRPESLLTTAENLVLVYHYNALFEYAIPEIITIEKDLTGTLSFKIYKYTAGKYETVSVDVSRDANPEMISDGEDSNYIFFTSGSTGEPKAVLGRHKSLSHFIHWETKELTITANDRIGQLTSFSFDASLRDIFVPLISGAMICIPPKETKEDISQLAGWLSEQGVTILHTIPTLFRLLTSVGVPGQDLNKYACLRYILLAGEKLYYKDITDWRNRYGDHTVMINLYGATESTLVKSFYKIDKELSGDPSDVICVGKPISNTTIIILNDDDELCRIGETGKVYIRTPFLSKGYYQDAEQTAEKFIQNPLIREKDIIYKTGDYGRYDKDRNIIVLGREDGIIKLNGVRIDLDSIESILLRLNDVQMVKCILYEGDTLNAALVCFYKSDLITEKELRDHCARYLSQYESPSVIFRLTDFPVNVNGKTDIPALKESIRQRLSAARNNRPHLSGTEEKLAGIWKEVLSTEQVDIEESFLALGGNSIKQILLRSKIKIAFNVNLSMNDLFLNHTIALQAILLSDRLKTGITNKDDRITPAPYMENGYMLSSEQLRIWATSQSDAGSLAHNMSYTYAIHGDFKIELFKDALQNIVNRHEALRTRFLVNKNGETVQEIVDDVQIDSIFDYIPANKAIHEEDIREILKKFSGFVFDLATAPLFRVLLIESAPDKFILSTLMHHIIGDYTSDQIIIDEVIQLYGSGLRNIRTQFNEIKVQYKDYAYWIQNRFSGEDLSDDRNFWNTHLSGIFRLNKWHKTAEITNYEGAYDNQAFDDDLVRRLREYCAATNHHLMGVLAAALGILIHKISGQQDVLIGVPVNLRNHQDLTGQVGLYLNLLPLRIKIEPEYTAHSVLDETAKNQVKLMDHSFYPFDKILDEFEEKNKFSLADRIDLYLNFINTTDRDHKKMDHLEFVAQDREIKMSKFPICVYVDNSESKISFKIEYQTRIFEPLEISKLAERFSLCVEQVLKYPDHQIRSISLVDKKSIPTFSLR